MGLEAGLELIRAGAYFEAHEELEDEWREAPPEERDFLQGLVHVAVAWLHAGRGNRPGCERQLVKARRRLGAVLRRRTEASTSRRYSAQVTAAERRLAAADSLDLGTSTSQNAGSIPSHSRKRFRYTRST